MKFNNQYDNDAFEAMFQSVNIQYHPSVDPFAHVVMEESNNTTNNATNTETTNKNTTIFERNDMEILLQQQQQQQHNNNNNTFRQNNITSLENLRNLPQLPMYHPLEQTAITLPMELITTVTSQISIFLCQHSIAAIYNNNDKTIDCKTMNLLKFTILLWKKDNNNMIVEIQRRQGCVIEMRSIRSLLYQEIKNNLYNSTAMDAITTTTTTTTSTTMNKENESPQQQTNNYNDNNKFIASSFLPNSSPQGNKWIEQIIPSINNNDKRDQQETIMMEKHQQTLKACAQMISSIRYDEQRLGLEMLLSLSDESKSFHVQEVSKAFLSNQFMLQDILMQFFENIEQPTTTTTTTDEKQQTTHHYDNDNDDFEYDSDYEFDNDDDDDDDEEMMFQSVEYRHGNNHGEHHLLALQILSNILSIAVSYSITMDNNTTRSSLLSSSASSLFWESAISSMFYNIGVASYRPQEASVSINCLRSLIVYNGNNNIFNQYHRMQSLIPAVQQACAYGRSHHYILQKESEQMLVQLSY